MQVPKNIKGKEVLALLNRHYGYQKTRQIGSHIRATTNQNGQHHVTIPDHSPIKENTLKGIIADVAKHFGTSGEAVCKVLFDQ
jgi:predicted RNA binding protein YcfA (HicA-like mRNA interferase family)